MIEQETLCSLREMYVLGGLSEKEQGAFERHLLTCSSCQVEVRSLREVEAWLLEDYASIDPPSGMKERVLHHVFADTVDSAWEKAVPFVDVSKEKRSDLIQASPCLKTVRSGLMYRKVSAWQSLLASAAIAVIAVFVTLQSVRAPISPSLPMLGRVQQSLTLKSTSFIPLAQARVMITQMGSQKQLYISLSHLAPVTGTEAYQVWLVQPRGRGLAVHSLGVFLPMKNGSAAFASTIPTGNYSMIAITLEPRTINKTPQGPKVLMGTANV